VHDVAAYNKWWKNAGTCNSRDETPGGGDKRAHSLGVANVGGTFVILIAGLGLAALVALLEFVWYNTSHRDHDHHSQVVQCSIKYLTVPNSSHLRHCACAISQSLVRRCLLGPFYGAIAVPSVTRCRCCCRRCRRGHRCAGGMRQYR